MIPLRQRLAEHDATAPIGTELQIGLELVEREVVPHEPDGLRCPGVFGDEVHHHPLDTGNDEVWEKGSMRVLKRAALQFPKAFVSNPSTRFQELLGIVARLQASVATLYEIP